MAFLIHKTIPEGYGQPQTGTVITNLLRGKRFDFQFFKYTFTLFCK